MIKEYKDAVVSFNERTGEKKIYNKVKGRIDNRQYTKDNADALLQPDNPKFVRVYGEEAKKHCNKVFKQEENRQDELRRSQEEIEHIGKNYKNKFIC